MANKHQVENMSGCHWLVAVALLAGTVFLASCGGGGGGGTPTPAPTPTPTPTPVPQVTLSSVVPASGAAGVARDVKPVITLTVTNATASDGSKLALICASRTITFTAASALSTDAKTMTVTLTPQASAILTGDNCTLAGDVTTTGAGGTAKTSINTSFSIYATTVAKGLSLIAGTVDSPGSKDGQLLEASMYKPGPMTRDAQGNIYVAEGCQGSNAQDHFIVRKLSTNGMVTTVAGSPFYGGKWVPDFFGPENRRCVFGITAHPDGNLYVYDYYKRVVQQITPQGIVTVVAGAIGQVGSSDGRGTAARFDAWGIAADSQGNLFIADNNNHTIRRIDSSGNVTTYAGQAGTSGSADGTLLNARFDHPGAIKFDAVSGKMYVGDNNGLRAIENGTVVTVIPNQTFKNDLGGDGTPRDLDIDADGRIAVAFGNNGRVGIYKNNVLATRLGSDGLTILDRYDDADGSPTVARFRDPWGVAFRPNGDLLISDIGNHNIKRYSASANSVDLFAGKRRYWKSVDGVGSAAKFDNPVGMYLSKTGDIWVSRDPSMSPNGTAWVDANGKVNSVSDPVGTNRPSRVMTVNTDGSFIELADSPTEIRHRSASGTIIASLATLSSSEPGHQFASIWSIQTAEDSNGALYVYDFTGGILKYSNGTVSKFAQADPNYSKGWIQGMAMLPSGDLVISTINYGISKVSPAGVVTALVPVFNSGLNHVNNDGDVGTVFIGYGHLAVDSKGAIYMVNRDGSVIRRIFEGKVTTVAGTWWVDETEVGTGSGKLHEPRDIAYDASSNSLLILTNEALLRADLP